MTTIDGRYRLDERIGAGGMGEVWKGQDLTLDRTVAVKLLHANLRVDAESAKRFEAEARTLAQLHHPNVVSIYDFGRDGDSAYLVMEYVPGPSLGAILRGETGEILSRDRALDIVAQAGDALQIAHERGIIHRDVKPDNLIVKDDGTVVLTDFGIARTDQSMTMTATGTVIGTSYYMAPELVAGRKPLPASDQYALGIVAYRCLAGRLPFEADSPMDVAVMQLRDPVPPLPADVPRGIAAAVNRALEKDPPKRYGDCAAFAAAVRGSGAADAAGTTRQFGAAPPTQRFAGAAAVGGRATAPTGRMLDDEGARTRTRPVPAAAPVPMRPQRDGGGSRKVPIILGAVALLAIIALVGYLLAQPLGNTDDGAGGDPTSTPTPTDDGADDATQGDDQPQDDEQDTGADADPEDSQDTDPGQEDPDKDFTVPNIVGLSIDDAEAEVLKKGLTFWASGDDQVDPESDPGTCLALRQDKQPGDVLEEGEQVIGYYHPGCFPDSGGEEDEGQDATWGD